MFAILASLSFAASMVLVRKAAAQAGESFTAMTISVFIGIPFFAIIIFFKEEWHLLLSISWRAVILLGAAGIIHFVVGRMLGYHSFRLIGANKATPYITTNTFYAVIFGIIFLGENLTLYLVFGVICIFAGAALITTERKSVSEAKQKGLFRGEGKGILSAMGAALCWGTTPILIKLALREVGSPFVCAFVAYVVAAIVVAFFLLVNRQYREQIPQLPFIPVIITLIISGLLASTGQLFNYTALGLSPASIVVPIMGTNVLFIFLFSFLINRQIEVFTPKVILGMLAAVAGTFLLFQ